MPRRTQQEKLSGVVVDDLIICKDGNFNQTGPKSYPHGYLTVFGRRPIIPILYD